MTSHSRLKPHKQLLTEGQEYSYAEAFNIYDLVAIEECERANTKIDNKNKKEKKRTNSINETAYSQMSDENDERERIINKRRKALLIWGILLIVIGLVLLVAIIGIIPILIGLWLIFVKRPKLFSSFDYAEELQFEPEPHVSFTYLPIGTIACSSCGTKTKIEGKGRKSNCPNCHSEIFVISQMDKNVQVKQLAKQ